MTIDDISYIMAQGNYFSFHKKFAKYLGLEEAIILGALINKYQYYFDQGKLTEDGMFFCTVNTLYEDTTLSEYKQRKAFKNLEENGIITTDIRGIPAKRYIKLNAENMINILRKF